MSKATAMKTALQMSTPTGIIAIATNICMERRILITNENRNLIVNRS